MRCGFKQLCTTLWGGFWHSTSSRKSKVDELLTKFQDKPWAAVAAQLSINLIQPASHLESQPTTWTLRFPQPQIINSPADLALLLPVAVVAVTVVECKYRISFSGRIGRAITRTWQDLQGMQQEERARRWQHMKYLRYENKTTLHSSKGGFWRQWNSHNFKNRLAMQSKGKEWLYQQGSKSLACKYVFKGLKNLSVDANRHISYVHTSFKFPANFVHYFKSLYTMCLWRNNQNFCFSLSWGIQCLFTAVMLLLLQCCTVPTYVALCPCHQQELHIELIQHNRWCWIDSFCLDVSLTAFQFHCHVILPFPKGTTDQALCPLFLFPPVIIDQYLKDLKCFIPSLDKQCLVPLVLPALHCGLMTTGAGPLLAGFFFFTIHSLPLLLVIFKTQEEELLICDGEPFTWIFCKISKFSRKSM